MEVLPLTIFFPDILNKWNKFFYTLMTKQEHVKKFLIGMKIVLIKCLSTRVRDIEASLIVKLRRGTYESKLNLAGLRFEQTLCLPEESISKMARLNYQFPPNSKNKN